MASKKKRTLLWVFIVLAVLLLVPAGLYLAGNLYYTPKRLYELNWKIELPASMKQEYDVQTPQAPMGEGLRYTVFKLTGNDVSFLKDASSQKDADMEADVCALLDELKADKGKYPNFSDFYSWKKLSNNDSLYIILDKDNFLVYFVQHFK